MRKVILVLMCVLTSIAVLAGERAMAQEAAKEPAAWSILTYVWVGVWGTLGGIISFYQKVRTGATRWLNIGELVGEMGTSAFVAVITGLLCEWAKAPAPLTWALAGITGHMGGRAIFWLENAAQRWAEKKLGLPPAQPQGGTDGRA